METFSIIYFRMRYRYRFSVQHDAPDAFDGRFEFDRFFDAHDDDANHGKSAFHHGPGKISKVQKVSDFMAVIFLEIRILKFLIFK